MKKPWTPPATALNCFQAAGKKFFEGRGLIQRNRLRGRQLELKNLKEIVEASKSERKTSVAITGIGGIG